MYFGHMNGFRKILIPVDFSAASSIAIQKAFGFLEEHGEIMLLHVGKIGYSEAAKRELRDSNERLEEMKSSIERERKGLFVKSLILYGHSIETMIHEGSRLFAPDLIIIGRQGRPRHRLFRSHVSPDRIARKVSCPVLTVRAGAVKSSPHIVVIPVRQFVSRNKLDLAVRIAKKFRARVILLVFGHPDAKGDASYSPSFFKAYHHLREKLYSPVEHCTCPDRNTARATLDYAESVKADMILADPEEESGIYTWSGVRHISDLIPDESSIQILEVEPEPNFL